MDPNAALEAILRGHMIADHAEALEGWLARGGFAPTERPLDGDTLAPFIRAHCSRHYPNADLCTIDVRANRFGLWTSGKLDGRKTPWISLATFAELKRIED